MESIYDLMDKVREHPDYVFGTVFTWADVEDRLELLQESEGVSETLTLDMLKQYSRGLEKSIEIALMSSDWTEPIDNVIYDAEEKEES